MKPIPSDILAEFDTVPKNKTVPTVRHADCRKWLMYYLDFSRFNDWNCLKKTDSPEWDGLISNLAAEIKPRHRPLKTNRQRPG